MAEALLRLIDSGNFEAFSAGGTCEPVHPLSIEVMKEIGIDLGTLSRRTIDSLREQTFDFIITLDNIAAQQSRSLNAVETVHWKFENPAAVSHDYEVQRRAFRSVRDQIAQRLRLFAIVHVRPGVPAEPTRLAAERGNPVIQAS
jgi:protein-tyrosine-phosphatase